MKWLCVDAMGLAADILVLWDTAYVTVLNNWGGKFSVHFDK